MEQIVTSLHDCQQLKRHHDVLFVSYQDVVFRSSRPILIILPAEWLAGHANNTFALMILHAVVPLLASHNVPLDGYCVSPVS